MKKILKELIPYIVIVIVVLSVRTFIVTPGIVRGASMEDTLFDKDLVIVNKIGLKKGIDRFDIVVVEYEKDILIKRVIGLPNENVEYKNNVLYIDDKRVDTPINFEYTKDFKITAKEDEYVVLGDNRNVSKDSRIIGPINIKDIKGKVNLILFPFKRFGYVK